MRYRDLVDVLCVYDVTHCEFPLNPVLAEMSGAEDPEIVHGLHSGVDQKIWIKTKMPLIIARECVVHEMLHGYYELKGIDASETRVTREARAIYKELFRSEE